MEHPLFSALMAAMTLAMPLGLLVAGPVAEAVGVNTWFFWSGAALIADAIFCRLLTRRYDREIMRPESPEPESSY